MDYRSFLILDLYLQIQVINQSLEKIFIIIVCNNVTTWGIYFDVTLNSSHKLQQHETHKVSELFLSLYFHLFKYAYKGIYSLIKRKGQSCEVIVEKKFTLKILK